MVRSELLQKLCNLYPNILRADMDKILETIFREITLALCEGKNIEIRGFGRVTTKIQKPRMGRNPKTGEQIRISASRKVKWKMSKILYKRLNKNFTENKTSAKN